MAAPAGPPAIHELRHRYAAQPRRYLAPLASALRQQGALEEAVTMLRAQLAEYPDHLTAHVVLGQALFDTGALAESREAFERARTLDPGNPVVLRHLGEIASLGGDVATARRWYGRLRAAETFADDVGAQLDGRGELPPGYDAEDEAPVAAPAGQEVREAERLPAPELPPVTTAAVAAGAAEPSVEAAPGTFELLEFAPATPALEASDDPVVGLDLPPAAPPAELRAGIADDDADQLDAIAGGPFATETMAGLLAAQGHTEQAIALYERLAAERPDDVGLQSRLAALRGDSPETAAPDAAAPARTEGDQAEDARSGFATHAETHAETHAHVADDATRAALLADAFADLPASTSEAAAGPREPQPEHPVAAPETVAGAGAADPLDADPDPFAEFSFDRFFAEQPPSVPAATSPAAEAARVREAAPTPDVDDADLARFDAWLQQTRA